jgi:hypothetical protein
MIPSPTGPNPTTSDRSGRAGRRGMNYAKRRRHLATAATVDVARAEMFQCPSRTSDRLVAPLNRIASVWHFESARSTDTTPPARLTATRAGFSQTTEGTKMRDFAWVILAAVSAVVCGWVCTWRRVR